MNNAEFLRLDKIKDTLRDILCIPIWLVFVFVGVLLWGYVSLFDRVENLKTKKGDKK